jgi:hypothetical protein
MDANNTHDEGDEQDQEKEHYATPSGQPRLPAPKAP